MRAFNPKGKKKSPAKSVRRTRREMLAGRPRRTRDELLASIAKNENENPDGFKIAIKEARIAVAKRIAAGAKLEISA